MFVERPRLSVAAAWRHSRPMDKTTQQAVMAAITGAAPRQPRNPAERLLVAAMVALQLLALGGCTWLGLAWGAFSYPTTRSGEPANVVVNGDWAYVTRGKAGLEVLRLGRHAESRVFPLPPGLQSVDDVAVDGELLFVLDAEPPGHMAVFWLEDPAVPRLLADPVAVEVGPFSGITAAAGRVIVSGGTSRLSLRAYDAAGRLGDEVATADFGRGQPDVQLDAGGELAFVSTHNWGPYFGLTLIRAGVQPPAVVELSTLPLDTYGFTPGGARPASFPIETASEGSRLYVAFAGGLGVVDVADPAAPKLLSRIDPGVTPVNVDVHDGIAAVVGSQPSPRLVFVDVHDAANPQVLQSFPLPEGSLATGVALSASYAVVAAHGRGTLLFDRSEGAWEHISHPFLHLTPRSPTHEIG
jgi:hypothetical protein